jgi:glycosyltransferase involved in cell wall biosynthesis
MVQRGLKIRDDISLFIAPTEFVRDIFPPQFLNPGKVVVKPHFVQTDPGQRNTRGSYALYLGRLSEEKGVRSLMKAWKNIPEVPLVVVGDGPLRGETLAFVSDQNLKSVEMIGYKPPGEVVRLLKNSAFLILPSICYEVFPRVIVEAFSCGVPVLVPSHGAPAELVADSVTGLWFEPADEADLAAKVRWAWTHPDEMELMGKRARAEFESKYTADRNYDLLFRIYQRVIEEGLPA